MESPLFYSPYIQELLQLIEFFSHQVLALPQDTILNFQQLQLQDRDSTQ